MSWIDVGHKQWNNLGVDRSMGGSIVGAAHSRPFDWVNALNYELHTVNKTEMLAIVWEREALIHTPTTTTKTWYTHTHTFTTPTQHLH